MARGRVCEQNESEGKRTECFPFSAAACFLLMCLNGFMGFAVATGKHAPEKAECQCFEAFPLERVKHSGHCVFSLDQAGEREVYVSL